MKFWKRRERKENELDEEVRGHLERAAAEGRERGLGEKEAQTAARREFGNVELVKETARDAWGLRWLAEFADDTRFALRMMKKSPGFTATVILTLALGIGANTALFSMVNGVLLNPLPFPHPEQLVTLHASKPNFATGSISYPNFLDWQKDNRTFASMELMRAGSCVLTGLGDAEQLPAELVSAGFFAQLGVKPVLGRTFLPGEDLAGAAPTVMISAKFWKEKLTASHEALGKALTLDGKDYTIIGVVPESFDLLGRLRTTDVYLPIGQWNNPNLMDRGAGLGFHGIGRMKEGVTLEQAREDMKRVTENLAKVYPNRDKGVGATIVPLREQMLGRTRPLLLLLLGAVGFVLLIASVNVANLTLARATGRTHEFAMRAALGAGRGRIVRQVLTESTIFAAIGGGLGILLAAAGTKTLLEVLPSDLPRSSEVAMDWRVLAFAGAISLVAGLCFGLAPALKMRHASGYEALKEGGRGKTGRHGPQGVLVAAEVALAVVLLTGAGLMVRTLATLWKVNPGFNPKNLLVFGFSLPPSAANGKPEVIRNALRQAEEKFRSVPGVTSASFSWGAIPFAAEDDWLFWIDGQPKPATDSEMGWALDYVVSPSYFQTMGLTLKSGRFLTEQDDERAPGVVVIDEVLARKYFPGIDPIGQRVHVGGEVREIVGVVGHIKQWGLDTDDKELLREQMYLPLMQLPEEAITGSSFGALVRWEGAKSVLPAIQGANRGMSPDQAVYGAQTMGEIIRGTLAARRFLMILLSAFAVLALALASVGIYGVVSYLTGQRTQEIGVRMAVGAQRGQVLRMVLAQGGKMAVAGALGGIAAALMLTRLMTRMLYGISSADPLTYFSVVAMLVAVCVAACWIPARRATKVDPMAALRHD